MFGLPRIKLMNVKGFTILIQTVFCELNAMSLFVSFSYRCQRAFGRLLSYFVFGSRCDEAFKRQEAFHLKAH